MSNTLMKWLTLNDSGRPRVNWRTWRSSTWGELAMLWLLAIGMAFTPGLRAEDLPTTNLEMKHIQQVFKAYTQLALEGDEPNPKALLPYGHQMGPDTFQAFSFGRLSPSLGAKSVSDYRWNLLRKIKSNRLEIVGDEEYLYFNLFEIVDDSHYSWRNMVSYTHPIHALYGKGDRYIDPIYLFSALFWLNGSDRMLSIDTFNAKKWALSVQRVVQFYALTAFFESLCQEKEVASWGPKAKKLFIHCNKGELETFVAELSTNYKHERYGEFARLLTAVVYFSASFVHGETTPVGLAFKDQALLILNRLQKLYPNASSPYYWMGILQMDVDSRHQDFSDSLTLMETAMRAEPQNPEPFLLTVNLYRFEGRNDMARQILTKWGLLYKMNSEMEKLFLNLSAAVHFGEKDIPKAREEFAKAYQLSKNLVSQAGLADCSFVDFQREPESQDKLAACAELYDQLLVTIEDYESLQFKNYKEELHGVFKQQFFHYYHRYFYLSSFFSSPKYWTAYVDSAISHFISYNSPRLVFRLLNDQLAREFIANTLGYRFSTDKDLMTRMQQLEADEQQRKLPTVSGNAMPGVDGTLPPHHLTLPFDETKFVRLSLKDSYRLIRNALDVYDNDIFLNQLNLLLKDLIVEMLKPDGLAIACYIEEKTPTGVQSRSVPLNYISGQTVLLTLPKEAHQSIRQTPEAVVFFKTSSGMDFGLKCKETQVIPRKDAYVDVMYQFVELSAEQNALLTKFINLYDTLK